MRRLFVSPVLRKICMTALSGVAYRSTPYTRQHLTTPKPRKHSRVLSSPSIRRCEDLCLPVSGVFSSSLLISATEPETGAYKSDTAFTASIVPNESCCIKTIPTRSTRQRVFTSPLHRMNMFILRFMIFSDESCQRVESCALLVI